MIEEKDASKNDKRRVKNTSNPLTRKSKGETHTMGERCTLKTVFVIGLMLLTAMMLSVTAMAAPNDGKGHVEVSWGAYTGDPLAPPTAPDDDTPLNAGSELNMVRFIYDAHTLVPAGSTDPAEAIDMSGGQIRIAIPAGWKVPDKVIVEEDRDADFDTADTEDDATVQLYNSAGIAPAAGTGVIAATDDSEKRVTFKADKYITVNLGDKWAKRNRAAADTGINIALRITFYEVTTGIPRSLGEWDADDNAATAALRASAYGFNASSRAMNGTHIRLDNEPMVYVGNILANMGETGSRDKTERKVVITPTEVFQTETGHRITISFTAPGPMYGATLSIPIPADVQPAIAASSVTVSKSSGVVLGDPADLATSPELTITGGTGSPPSVITLIVVNLTEIDVGEKVTVSYPLATVGSSGTAADFARSATGVRTTLGTAATDIAVNKLEGGKVRTVAGSGTLAISPVAIEAGAKRRTINLTYTAQTALPATTMITVTPAGIATPLASGNVTGATLGTGDAAGSIILDVGDGLAKGKVLKATIKNVDIVTTADEYPWTVMHGTDSPDTADVDETLLVDDARPTLSVVYTKGDAVSFEVVGPDTFPAGSKQMIMFRFTADKTPIRDGRVSFTIPSTLGSAPTITKDAAGRVTVSVSGGELAKDQATKPGISGRTINVGVKKLDVGGSVTITYGDAVLHHVAAKGDNKIKIRGTFRNSAGSSTRTAMGTADVEIGNVEDGTGTATLSPITVEAGSNNRAFEVTFTASGTMDGGMVVLEKPTGWGDMQDDPTKRNYVTTRGSGVASLDVGATRTIATISKLAKGGSFRFIYGGGTAGTGNGVDVDTNPGTAKFMIKSDGDGDGVFVSIKSELKHEGREKIRNPDKLGKIFNDAAGELQVKVTSAADGQGVVKVVDANGDEVTAPSVRAAADDVILRFTFTPTQTITDGALKFTVPASWSKPQVEETGMPGYTEVDGPGIGTVTDDDKFSVTVPIFNLDKNQMITITYGATATGRAMASTAVGDSAFMFETKGDATGNFRPIRTQPSVTVNPQASGKGKAVVAVTGDALHAGDMDREITVTYTAAGQIVAGKVRLTIPAKWSAPTADNVTVMSGTEAITPTLDVQMVTADGINLLAGGQVTFTYTGDVQPTDGTATFAVAVNGGQAGDAFAAVSGDDTMLTVDVGQARRGSGSGSVSPIIVDAGATGMNLQFTYTAVGRIDAPREFRVQVPASWTAPSNAVSSTTNKGTYTITHRHMGVETQTSIEKLAPIGRDLVARVKAGGLEVEAGDEIIFTFENVDAPATPEVSEFKLIFDGSPIADDVSIRVQDSSPSMLSISSAGTVSADAGAAPLAVTVGLTDADGDAVAQNTDVVVTLNSSSAGTFAMMMGETGTESAMVTIAAGKTAAMAYYMDSTAGDATISATATGLTMASQMITVTTSVISITEGSVMVDPSLAMAGEMVTVSAMGTPGQTAMFSVGEHVTDMSMSESPSGSYSGSFTVSELHTDGMYDVTVSVGSAMATATGALTLDSTAPTVTASASPDTVANGGTVMISAMVTEAGMVDSVMADVSALDSTQTDMVSLAMGDDGSYSASVMISEDNTAENGSKTITVTAMDAAGNSGMGTAMVMLDNKLTYTSMIPAGTSLFHVPLDVEDLDTVGDLKMMIGDTVNLLIVYDTASGSWNSRSDDVMITADLGIIVSLSAEATVTFTGDAWGGGASTLNLSAGSNLIGLPVDAPNVTNVSDIAGLFGAGVVTSVVVSTADGFESVTSASDAADGPVSGDAAYLVTANADATAALVGSGWSTEAANAAPIALAGYSVDSQTPVLDVNGSVVDELTGLARDGFRVKVKNLSTKTALSKVTSVETAEGYNMTFVDLNAAHAARVGDVLEITAESPNPLIGVTPVRHIVTVDDVKRGILELEDLIAYEIPAETELLRNYPNPFNPETWIPYYLSEDADVTLTIYNVSGELVRSIDVGHQTAAKYDTRAKAIYWDGRNRFGEQVASGVYFYSLSAGDFSATRKMVILK